MRSLLIWVAVVEGLLICLGVVAMALGQVYLRRQRKRIADVRSYLARFAAEDGEIPLPPWMKRLRPIRLGRLLAGLASQLTGRDRTRLIDLGNEAGINATVRRWCASRRWWRRLQGAQLRTTFARMDVLTLRLLRDPHPLVRAEAARSIGIDPGPWACGELIRVLDDDSLACRNAARDALSRAGASAGGPVLEALGNAGTPARALVVLLDIAAHQSDPRIVPAVAAWLHSKDRDVRAAAAVALGSLGGATAREALLSAANDPAVEVRVAAIRAIGSIGVAEDAHVLLRGLEAEEWQIREASGAALLGLGAVGRMHLRRAVRGSAGSAADTAQWVLQKKGLAEKSPHKTLETAADMTPAVAGTRAS